MVLSLKQFEAKVIKTAAYMQRLSESVQESLQLPVDVSQQTRLEEM